MANSKMPPGATQGIAAGKDITTRISGAGGGSGLDGHTAGNLGAVAPCDEHPAPVNPTQHLFGNFSD